MATSNTMSIVNGLSVNVYLVITGQNFNCCDTPKPGDLLGCVLPTQSLTLNFLRTDGHGCNGKQGQFSLGIATDASPQDPGQVFNVPFDFDSDGNIQVSGQVPGIDCYLVQELGGTAYSLTLRPSP